MVISFFDYYQRIVVCFIFLQPACYLGLDLRYRHARSDTAIVRVAKHCCQLQNGFIPLAGIQAYMMVNAAIKFLTGAAALDELYLAVLPRHLFHLRDAVMRL
jgi:hypothetical protein